MNKIIEHYDLLIEKGNDPVNDSLLLRQYMNKWDGDLFIKALNLDSDKTVLEIGVGTGRIAVKVILKCLDFTGIDISSKTIKKAREHLSRDNVNLICDDFMQYSFKKKFDIIYSTLTFMHFSDKFSTIQKVSDLLKKNGRFILSIDKNQALCINTIFSSVRIFPDDPARIREYLEKTNLKIEKQIETEHAYIFISTK